jgi:hypothetical protein
LWVIDLSHIDYVLTLPSIVYGFGADSTFHPH